MANEVNIASFIIRCPMLISRFKLIKPVVYVLLFQRYVLGLTTGLMNELEVRDEGTTEQKYRPTTIT